MRRAASRAEAQGTRNRKESLIGTLLCVCSDCKEMVLQVCQHSLSSLSLTITSAQVIRAQKTARRLQMTQSLFLNLSPAYSNKQEIH